MTVFEAISGTAGPLRVVIDTNSLASDELKAFLSASKANRAVLPDYVAMERFKPDSLEALRDGFSVLTPFADQVVILKGTGEISGLNPDEHSFPEAMVDKDQTACFGEFCHLLDRALDGDAGLLGQLRERAGWAQAQMSVVLAGASRPSGLLRPAARFGEGSSAEPARVPSSGASVDPTFSGVLP